MKDNLGDRMKAYEPSERFMKFAPVYARLDGRSFSKFTKGMEKPADWRMSLAMANTTKRLMKDTGAIAGYTQSDEISLLYYEDKPESEMMFGGKVQKMCSTLASLASVVFCVELAKNMEFDKIPTFDCRILQLPNKTEAANMFVWRSNDGARNFINTLSQCHFSHKELNGKSTTQQIEDLRNIGINPEKYLDFFRFGSLYYRGNNMELNRPLREVANREAVLFDGESIASM